jgi:hypothetical protein
LKGWIGVTSASPHKICIREKPALMLFIAGIEMPCVCAAPRAMVFQRLSTSLGVARIRSTGGLSRT